MSPRLPPEPGEAERLRAVAARHLAGSRGLRPLPGAAPTVSALAARGVPQACVSTSHRAVVDADLQSLGLAGAMAFTTALGDVAAGEPEPYAAGLAVAPCGPAPIPRRWAARVARVADLTDVLSRFAIPDRRR